MIVRHPNLNELERAGEVGHIAFTPSDLNHWVESYRRRAELCGLDYLFVVEVDGQIVSSLLCTPGPIWCGGDVVSHSAVGGVATIPEFRQRGCAGAMMTRTVKRLRELGIHTSSLWPFSYPYYRKFGWEVGCERKIYSGAPEVFAGLGDPGDVTNTAPEDIPDVMSVCDRFASRFAGPTKRSEVWWSSMSEAGLVFDDDCQPDGRKRIFLAGGSGYAVYSWSEKDGEKSVHIDELAALDSKSACSLLAKAGSLDARQISCIAPSNDPLLHRLAEPRKLQVRLEPGFQFRVIDPPAALASRTPESGVSGKLAFKLTDPVFTDGWKFTADLDNGSMAVSKAETPHEISTSVEIFAKLFVSYLRPREAVELGFAQASSEEAIALAEAVFRPMTPFRSGVEPG